MLTSSLCSVNLFNHIVKVLKISSDCSFMKVLVTFEKEISFAISRNELENLNTSRRHKALFILKCILFGFLYCSAFISCAAHLLTETKSFQEAADTFYWLLTMGACFIYFLFIWNGRKIFALIDRFESTIDERKLYFWKIYIFDSSCEKWMWYDWKCRIVH